MGIKLQVQDIRLEYTNEQDNTTTLALRDLSFEVQEGEFVAIVGPSGCGKTTFLNCMAGLLSVNTGEMFLDGKRVDGPQEDIAMVFQSPCLFPWRTVRKNIIYGLEIAKVPIAEAADTVRYLTALVGLKGFENFYPHQLSGGMQQRVNLARALVVDPKLLILDEPFANLDAQTREFMQVELLRIWEAARKTAVFVTHQINEAIFLADRVIVFTARPGCVKEIVTIDLPRPRQLSLKRSPEFLALEDRIWVLIEDEVRKSGLFTTVQSRGTGESASEHGD
ncbi:ABC transporter ATP-binding protein [Chloroflexota bacterium]